MGLDLARSQFRHDRRWPVYQQVIFSLFVPEQPSLLKGSSEWVVPRSVEDERLRRRLRCPMGADRHLGSCNMQKNSYIG
jgi:hypothetical protein